MKNISNTPGFPANPPEKEGWRLVFQEEFEGPSLDEGKLLPYGLAHWYEPGENLAAYEIKDSCLVLKLPDAEKRISAVATGMRDGLHRFWDKLELRRHVRPVMNLVTQYSYFELRAKVSKGSGINSAWWMIGFENQLNQNAEVDIFEVLGKDTHVMNSTLHALRDPDLKYEHLPYQSKDDLSAEFHVYGFEWDEHGMAFYLDNNKIWQTRQSPSYPMVTLLQINESDGGWVGELDPAVPYPKEFAVDYFRVYKKEGMPLELTPAETVKEGGNLAQAAVAGSGNDIVWGDLYEAKSHICALNDGNPDTVVVSKPGVPTPHAYYLDWAEPKSLNAVRLTVGPGSEKIIADWAVEVSANGLDGWIEVADCRKARLHSDDGSGCAVYEASFPVVRGAKALRLTIRGLTDDSQSYKIGDLAVFLIKDTAL
ncbi:glycoside hydrolase family 16 protein [Paenibacillus sp. VCA1]|uniref:glycoside hydrolase family 16 protein n=1 Tax=Paenibacillus sp. VCA1 TaxID=3039148 RepID=UPI0028729EA7|nr:glycoside hydrolase family 16 protein [Paenibacillus sp. VCA1]MDR9853771.1 glycoside hydrolase family 16 protein [Paenibacillus sp. VCA1]